MDIKRVRTIQVIYDEEDQQILTLLSYGTLTVQQIRHGLLFKYHKDVKSMEITRRLDKFVVVGDVIRTRKNTRVSEYDLAKE